MGGGTLHATEVRLMAPADFPFAVALTDTERWGFTLEDFGRFLAISPEGCFVAEHAGERGGLLTTALYGNSGWIGNVIVSSRMRGKGLGGALLKHAITHLERRGAEAIRLWAYENTVDLYAKFQFSNDRLATQRWIGFGHREHEGPPAEAPAGCGVFPVNPITLQQAAALDRKFFGADRWRVLERVVAENAGVGLVARDGSGQIVGLLLAKVSPKGCEVGPWVVDPSAAAWAVPCLLEAALANLDGKSVELGVYEMRKDVQQRLVEHGFHAGFRTLRMTRGAPEVGADDIAGVCAIGALEKG